MSRLPRRWVSTVILVPVLLTAAGAAVAETRSFKAAMSWNGHGRVLQINTSETEFLGVIEGILYIESAQGSLDEGFVECTVKQRMDISSGQASSEGNCVIIQSGDDNVFAEYRCEGQVGACRGRFTLTDGTGRFSGIKGASPMIVRSPLHHVSGSQTDQENLVVRNGVLLLTDLEVTLKEGR